METIHEKLRRLMLVEKNTLNKNCEICEGQGKVLINETPNNDPQHDEIEDCVYCDNGLVGNNEVIEDRLTEYDYTIRAIRENLAKQTERANELIYKIQMHQSRLKNKLSNQ